MHWICGLESAAPSKVKACSFSRDKFVLWLSGRARVDLCEPYKRLSNMEQDIVRS